MEGSLVCGVTRCASHRGQARGVASRFGVVLCDCAAVLAGWIGGLEADVIGLDVCLAATLIAREGVLDLVCDLAWEMSGDSR